MRHLKGNLRYGLRYASNYEIRLHGFIDSGWKGSDEGRKRTLGCCFSLGLGMISLLSRKQASIALSMAEDEYIATCLTCSEAVWICKMLVGLFDAEIDVTGILCDNHGCIKMIENLVFHDKNKLIKFRYHYIQDMVQKGYVKLKYAPT